MPRLEVTEAIEILKDEKSADDVFLKAFGRAKAYLDENHKYRQSSYSRGTDTGFASFYDVVHATYMAAMPRRDEMTTAAKAEREKAEAEAEIKAAQPSAAAALAQNGFFAEQQKLISQLKIKTEEDPKKCPSFRCPPLSCAIL